MSDKTQHIAPNGEVIGEAITFDERRPTLRSSGTHRDPDAQDGRRRLVVRCGSHVLLTALGSREPLNLRGRFTADRLLLLGVIVVTDRPDLDLAYRRAGNHDPRPPTVVADSARPLQLACSDHPQGHDVDPGRLRAEINAVSQTSSSRKVPSCQIGRVAAQD